MIKGKYDARAEMLFARDDLYSWAASTLIDFTLERVGRPIETDADFLRLVRIYYPQWRKTRPIGDIYCRDLSVLINLIAD